MSFLHPEFLYFMLVPLFVFFALLLTQREVHESFFSKDVMDRLRVDSDTLTLKARNALFLLMGIFIILALAQPVIDDGKVMVKSKSADIMVAIDISDSMLAQDKYPNRLKFAKQKALAFIKNAPKERIGVMAFAKGSYLVSPLSFDKDVVSFLLSELDTSSITQQGTDFDALLDTFIDSSKNTEERYLFILSDGGDQNDFSKEIAKAKQNNIVIFILGTATIKGAPIKLKNGEFIKQNSQIVVSKLNENIASFATQTGGVYIESTNSDEDIKTMLREIKRVAKSKELKSEEIHKYTQLFYYPLVLAVFILLIAISSFDKNMFKKMSMSALLLFVLIPGEAKALFFDFMDLENAKEFYKSADYKKSAEFYEKYANGNLNAQSFYNAANAYYKNKEYKKAIENYKKASFKDKNLEADRLSNLGNAYAKSSKLQKAVETYKKSLKLKDDKDTRENLQRVEEFLKKQKQKQKQKQKHKKEQNKKNRENSSGKNEQNKNKNKDKNDNQKKSKKGSESENDKKDNSKEQKKSSSESNKAKDSKQKKQDFKSKENQEQKKVSSESKKQKSSLEKLKENKKDKDKSGVKSHSLKRLQKNQMSDAEEMKWLKAINANNRTYLYKIGNKKTDMEKSYEKPW